ncbi:MAG: alpha/beta fold hydrolase [Anaerolineae bacterium]|nr:alpha/beta fold hydrolase [Anaerolineae bacterium]
MGIYHKGTKIQSDKGKAFVPFVSLFLCVLFLLAGCSSSAGDSFILPTLMTTAVVTTPESPQKINALLPVTFTPIGSAPAAIPPADNTPPPAATATIGPSPTYYAYAGWTIADLQNRQPQTGILQTHDILTTGPNYTRHLISYPSDGLTIYGFMNTPPTTEPLPVVLVLHGFVEPDEYDVEAYTMPYADELAKDGFLVIHPNYRNYPPSDNGDNLFRAGYAIDVLNLIDIIKTQAGQPGPLQNADPNRIFLFGHSMGGGIALRVLTVSQDVRAAALYSSMSGDEQRNFEKVIVWSKGTSGTEELAASAEDLQRISPIYHLENITVPISIHHGTADGVVPPEWSYQLCEQLRELGKEVSCYRYPGEPHNFTAAARKRMIDRVSAFFNES